MNKAKPKAITTFCRACGSRLRFEERPQLYEIVICPECEETFEVVEIAPLRLEWVAEGNFDDEEWFDEDESNEDYEDYENDEDGEGYEDDESSAIEGDDEFEF